MLLYPCNTTKQLYSKLQYFVSQNLNIPEINPQSALFGFSNIDNQKQFFINQPFSTIFGALSVYVKRTRNFLFHLFEIVLDKDQIEKKGKMLKSHWKYSKINTRL